MIETNRLHVTPLLLLLIILLVIAVVACNGTTSDDIWRVIVGTIDVRGGASMGVVDDVGMRTGDICGGHAFGLRFAPDIKVSQ